MSAASGQDVPGQERDGDDRRRDSDDGDGGGGYDHTAILASLFRVETAPDPRLTRRAADSCRTPGIFAVEEA